MIERDDLRTVAADLPAGMRAHAFSDPEVVVGAVATAPLDPGDPVLRSGAVASTGSPRDREFALVVEAAWADGGNLRVGDHIDLLVTYGDGTSSQTHRVLTDVVVRRLADGGDGGLGGTRTQTITVSTPDVDLVQAATNAARAGKITVVRTTGTRRAGRSTTYRPTTERKPGR